VDENIQDALNQERAGERDTFLRRHRYVRAFVFACLVIFYAFGLVAGFSLFKSEPTERFVVIVAIVIAVSLVGYAASNLNRKFGMPVPSSAIGPITIVATLLAVGLLY